MRQAENQSPVEIGYKGPERRNPEWKLSHAADVAFCLGGLTLTAPVVFLLLDHWQMVRFGGWIIGGLFFLFLLTFSAGTLGIVDVALSGRTKFGYGRFFWR